MRASFKSISVRRSRFLAGVLSGVLLVFMGAAIINRTPVADWIVAPLLLPDSSGPVDAVVVLGAGVIGECVPNLHALRRVLLGVRRWREQPSSVLLFSGGTGGSCSVAESMARLARELGVPDAMVRVETASTNTHENAELTTALLRGWGMSRILLVTDRLHMRRAFGTFDGRGFQLRLASVPIYEGHENNLSMLAAGLREFAALASYRLRGYLSPSRDDTLPPAMQAPARQRPHHPEGPVVLLGASYAAGLPLTSVGDTRLINRGVAGQESSDILERFDRDVVPESPRAVILWGFINDIVRTPEGQMDETIERIRANYTRLIARAREQGITPVVATEVTIGPPPGLVNALAGWLGAIRGKEAYQDRINRHVLAVDTWLAEVAAREGMLMLDFQRILGEPGGRRRAAFTQPDGSHITQSGYELLTTYARPVLEEYFRER